LVLVWLGVPVGKTALLVLTVPPDGGVLVGAGVVGARPAGIPVGQMALFHTTMPDDVLVGGAGTVWPVPLGQIAPLIMGILAPIEITLNATAKAVAQRKEMNFFMCY
jgi:hypothetical protein